MGVAPGSYTRSVLNKGYALRALGALRRSPTLAADKGELWRTATNGQEIESNSQMEVVTALWKAGLLRLRGEVLAGRLKDLNLPLVVTPGSQ